MQENVSFNKAYVPWLYKKLSQNDHSIKITIVKYTYIYFIVIILVAFIIAVSTPWFLSYFVGAKFIDAYRYTTWILLGFAFSGMYYMVVNYIFYANKTHILAAITILTAIINIMLNYVLIKFNGAVGAAQATAIALLISFVLTWVLSAKVYPMPWNYFYANVRNN